MEGVLSRVGSGVVILLDQILELLRVEVPWRGNVMILGARKTSEGGRGHGGVGVGRSKPTWSQRLRSD